MAKTLVGTVSSDKADKTITVTVVTRKTHPIYKKQYSESKKFMAHDEKNEAHIGDRVSIVETRPLSARKRYVLKEVLERPVIREETIDAVASADVPEEVKATKRAKESEEEESAE